MVDIVTLPPTEKHIQRIGALETSCRQQGNTIMADYWKKYRLNLEQIKREAPTTRPRGEQK